MFTETTTASQHLCAIAAALGVDPNTRCLDVLRGRLFAAAHDKATTLCAGTAFEADLVKTIDDLIWELEQPQAA